MSEYAPHHGLKKSIMILKSFNIYVFWIVFVLSVTPELFKLISIDYPIIDILNILNIIGISLYFSLNIIVAYILAPQADSIRRDDFIDNSFGSKFVTKSSIGYFDNDNISAGLYKAASNLFENCFFTLNLIKCTLPSKLIIPAFVILVILVFSYFGFNESPISLSVLKFLFSANILGDLIKHLILFTRLNYIQDSLISLFQNSDLKSITIKYDSFIYRYWLNYETIISKIQPAISDKIFQKKNIQLTNSWNEIKVKYNIN